MKRSATQQPATSIRESLHEKLASLSKEDWKAGRVDSRYSYVDRGRTSSPSKKGAA